MPRKKPGERPESQPLTGPSLETTEFSGLPATDVLDMLDAVVDASAFLSISAYDGGRTIRVSLQVRGTAYDEYVRDAQHLAAVVQAVTAKCMGDAPMRELAGQMKLPV